VESIANFPGNIQAATIIFLLGSVITSLVPFPLNVFGGLLLKGNLYHLHYMLLVVLQWIRNLLPV